MCRGPDAKSSPPFRVHAKYRMHREEVRAKPGDTSHADAATHVTGPYHGRGRRRNPRVCRRGSAGRMVRSVREGQQVLRAVVHDLYCTTQRVAGHSHG